MFRLAGYLRLCLADLHLCISFVIWCVWVFVCNCLVLGGCMVVVVWDIACDLRLGWRVGAIITIEFWF